MPDPGHAALALALGLVIGLSMGALGAGGSLLTVPILVYLMGVPVQAATATSLAIVGANAGVGALDALRNGRVLLKTGIAFGVSGLLGAFAGVWLNRQFREEVVLLLFSILMVAAAWGMVRNDPAGDDEYFEEHYSLGGWARLVGVGLGVGLLTGFFGVGGGFLIIPALVLVLGVPMGLAVGTSLLAIALNALWGLLGHLGFGGLDWGVTLLFVIGGVVGVILGGRVGDRLPEKGLRTAFALVIVGIALFTFAQSALALLRG